MDHGFSAQHSRRSRVQEASMVAKTIFKIAQTNIQEPAQISALAIKELELR
jgi:hypothetical protein